MYLCPHYKAHERDAINIAKHITLWYYVTSWKRLTAHALCTKSTKYNNLIFRK